MAICTLDDVKAYFGDADFDDTTMAGLITTAISQIEQYCGRSFASGEKTEFHSGGRGGISRIFLTNYPVDTTKDFKVYEDRTRAFPESSLIAAEDYSVDKDTGVVYLDVVLGPGNRNIKVTFTGGYADDDIPADLKQAIVEHTIRLWKEGIKGDLGAVQRQYPDGSVQLDRRPFYPSVQRTIDAYRNVSI